MKNQKIILSKYDEEKWKRHIEELNKESFLSNIVKKIRGKIPQKSRSYLKKHPLTEDLIFFLRRMHQKYFTNEIILISKEHKAIYIPVAKTACTSLRKLFLNMGFETVKYEKNFIKNSGWYIFTFVRNPYDRLVSCYINKIIKEKCGFASTSKLFKKDMSFKEFVDAVHSIPDKKSDPHIKSQYATLVLNGKLPPRFIGKFENLEEDYNKVCKEIGIKKPLKLIHENKSKTKRNKEYYDKKIKKLVQERYKKDFEIFGYKF